MKPPQLHSSLGKPCKNRKRNWDEAKGSNQRKFSKCGLFGHNTRTCKGFPKQQARGGASTTRGGATLTRGGVTVARGRRATKGGASIRSQ